MGEKESPEAHGLHKKPNTADKLIPIQGGPLPPEGVPVDTNSILEQMQSTRRVIKNKKPHGRNR